jgi:hypothetical protein
MVACWRANQKRVEEVWLGLFFQSWKDSDSVTSPQIGEIAILHGAREYREDSSGEMSLRGSVGLHNVKFEMMMGVERWVEIY